MNITKTHTACKDCIFTIYEDIEQTDCILGLIETYRKNGIEIVEAYDEEKEFFVINNAKCVYMRPKDWVHANKRLAEQMKLVAEETHLHFHAIIFINDKSLPDIKITLNSLLNQSLSPTFITLVRACDSIVSPSELYNLCSSLEIKWRIENLIEPHTQDETIKLIIPFVRQKVFITFNAGFEVPQQTLNDISKSVINDFLQFIMITPNKDGNGLVGLSIVYEYYTNYPGKNLLEKLEKDECPQKLLVPINQILPYFPK